jgi:glycerol uptake facilitator-like aquaporin
LNFYQAALAEFIGVFLLVLVVCGIGITINKSEPAPASINGALGAGLTVATIVWATNAISGANLNPAISMVLIFTNDLDLMRGVFYIICQLLGAVAGSATLVALVPEFARPMLGMTLVNDKITLLKAFGVEVIATFMLAFIVFACLDKNRKDLGGSFPLTIGLVVTIGALFAVCILFFTIIHRLLRYLIFNPLYQF